ncbi:hypothetical protein ACIBCN_08880 [Nocardia sp. NPDC051052]|uniref:hypothetical protein n=1 Tax=Nocardia sp. NPDC051052 TaxID=3364322 RepID=UPI00379BF87D
MSSIRCAPTQPHRRFHGVYREAATQPGPELRIEAARLSMGMPVLITAYDTVAELHGFPIAESNATHVLGVQLSRSKHLVVHRDRLDLVQVSSMNGVSTTTAARTAIDSPSFTEPIRRAINHRRRESKVAKESFYGDHLTHVDDVRR